MRLWGRGSDAQRIAAFWEWWAEHRVDVVLAAEAGEAGLPRLAAMFDPAVARMGDVGWEFGLGERLPWQLAMSPGHRALLPLTVAWVDAAPSDEAVEFLPAKPRRPGGVSGARVVLPDGRDVDLGELRCAVSSSIAEGVVDLRVYHPEFPSMSDEAQYWLSFMALDVELGEFRVMTATYVIEPVTQASPDMIPITDLRSVIDSHRR